MFKQSLTCQITIHLEPLLTFATCYAHLIYAISYFLHVMTLQEVFLLNNHEIVNECRTAS